MEIKEFKKVVSSLRQYHRIVNEKFFDGESVQNSKEVIKNLYVDLLPNDGILELMLEPKSTFLVGKKGTGKSTIIARAQYELREKKDYISVYINAKTVYKKCELNDIGMDLNSLRDVFSGDEYIKLTLIMSLISEIKGSLFEELEKEEYGFFDKCTNIFRNVKLNALFNELNSLVNNPHIINITKLIKENKSDKSEQELIAEIKSALEKLSVSSGVKGRVTETTQKEYSNIIARSFNIGEIINKLIEITKICDRKGLFVFIDDYSELDKTARTVFMETIISPLYILGVDRVFIKIAAYPNQIDPIMLDSGKYIIKNIDLYDIYGDLDITTTEKRAIEYTKRVLENRIKNYCTCRVEDYFDISKTSMEEYYKLLFYVSQNIPRNLGNILFECYSKATIYGHKINRSIITEAAKKYYKDQVEIYFVKRKAAKMVDLEEKIDVYVQEGLLKALIYRAQENKYKLAETNNSYFSNLNTVPTSHFTVSPIVSQYLDILEFNGFIYKINDIAAKGKKDNELKNENNYLYAFDYGLCSIEKIEYSKPDTKDTKFYQQRSFVYDEVILLALSKNKKIVCKKCGNEYPIEKLEQFKNFRMRCMDCDDGVCEIQYDRSIKMTADNALKKSIWTETEIEIIKAIKDLEKDEEEQVTANQISHEIDYSSRFIAQRCKELFEAGYIHRDMTSKPYKYSTTERTSMIFEQIINNEN